jgi:dihydroorotase
MVGFETALPLAYTYLVQPGHLSLSEVAIKMCVNPASLFNLNTGRVEAGLAADLIIFDAEKQKTVDRMQLHSKSKNSPFDGMTLQGVVETTIVDGRIVMEQQSLMKS